MREVAIDWNAVDLFFHLEDRKRGNAIRKKKEAKKKERNTRELII
jgi:hypothetical protein